MSIQLSWRQKFLALIALVIVSLASIALLVIWSSSTIATTYRFAYLVTRYDNLSGNVVMELNRVEQHADGNEIDAIPPAIDDLQQKVSVLPGKASDLNASDVIGFSEKIEDGFGRYASLRASWTELVKEEWNGPTTEPKSELSRRLEELKSISISIFDDPINRIAVAHDQYFQSLNSDMKEPADKALSDLEIFMDEKSLWDTDIGDSVHAYRTAYDNAVAVVERIITLNRQAEEAANALRGLVFEQSQSLQDGLIASSIKQAGDVEFEARAYSIGALTILAPLLIGLIYTASSALVRGLSRIGRGLARVAEGDLSEKIPVGRNDADEFNVLGKAANEMIGNIGQLIQQPKIATQQVQSVSEELNTSLGRMMKHSDSVETQTVQVAASTQEISVTLNDIAHRSSEVGKASRSANAAACSGTEVVERSVQSIQKLSLMIQQSHSHVQSLNAASGKVTTIVDVINSLAEQTNLLALNAAIEAARAGEAGRGFSVVADEVRSLAAKTVEATTNIEKIIRELQTQTRSMDDLITGGLALANEGEQNAVEIANTMQQVTGSVESLTDDIDHMVVAVEQISTTTEDIAQKMEGIREQTSESRSLSEQIGGASSRLNHHATVLGSSSERFFV